MSSQLCPTCKNYRAALITHKGVTRCTSCLVKHINDLEAKNAKLREELQSALQTIYEYTTVKPSAQRSRSARSCASSTTLLRGYCLPSASASSPKGGKSDE